MTLLKNGGPMNTINYHYYKNAINFYIVGICSPDLYIIRTI
jgi:hypothetical protein